MATFKTNGPKVTKFIETTCTLGGSYLGQRFVPLEWMRDVIDDVYRLNDDGTRRFRTYLIGVPRKNAKSTLGAALALYHLCIDTADSAPVVISAAGDKAQAKLVFNEAKRMVQASPLLSQICSVYRDEIHCHRTNGVYKAVSSDAGLQHGLNPSCVIVDEYHVHKNDELFVALQSGSAMRNQPLMIIITTAGFNLESPLGLLYQKGRRVESGEDPDTHFGFSWYGPKEGEEFDPSDPEVWERFNPSWSIMRPEEFEATYNSMHESQFIRYRLNGWTSTESVWLPHGAWDSCLVESTPLQHGDEIIVGFDGAWKGDCTAIVGVRISDGYVQTLDYWEAPLDNPHWRTPVLEVKEKLRDVCREYTVREILADPFRFEETLFNLYEEGLPIVEFPTNSVARMVPATQGFYDAVMDNKLTHNGDPVLARHLSNCVLKEDAKGARITKEYRSSKRHIDLAVAAVIAYQRARLFREEVRPDPQMLVL